MGAHHLHLRNASEVIVGRLFLRQQKQAATLNESLPCAAIERTRLRCAQSNQAVCSYVNRFRFFHAWLQGVSSNVRAEHCAVDGLNGNNRICTCIGIVDTRSRIL